MTAPSDGGMKKSFADILNSYPQNLTNGSSDLVNTHSDGLRKGLHRGKPAAFFSAPKLSSYAAPFKWALIGKFSQGRPRMEDIHKFFISLDLKGGFKLGLLDSRHIVINLDLEEDFHRIFSRLTWNVYRWPMRVFKYTVNFHVNKESSIVPIWVNLEKLPLVLFNKEALFTITSLIGTPLRLDTATADLKRPSVARVQVEIDLLKPALDTIWIGMGEEEGFWQEVKYENLPSYCSYCWHLGHNETHCMMKHPELKEANKPKMPVPKKALQAEKVYRPKIVSDPPQKEDDYVGGKKEVEVVRVMEQVTDAKGSESKEAWTVIQSRKAKKISFDLYPQSQGTQQDTLVDSKSLNDSLVAKETTPSRAEHGSKSSSVLISRVDEASSSGNLGAVEHNGKENEGPPNSDSSKAIVVYSHGSSDPSLRQGEIPNIENLSKEEIHNLVEEGILAEMDQIIHDQAERVLVEEVDESDTSSQKDDTDTVVATGNLSPRRKEFHPNHWKLQEVSSQDIEEEFATDFLLAQEKGFPSPMVLQLMRTRHNDNQEKEVSSIPSIEESNNLKLQQPQLHESDLSKAIVIYDQGQKEEFPAEAANELIEKIADRVMQEDTANFHKKSFAEVVTFQSPQEVVELQPLHLVSLSIPQVIDLTQEEIQNSVEKGIIAVEEGSMNEPVLEFDNNENDEENFEEELENLVERDRRKGYRLRRKNNRYRDFYC